VFKVNVALPQMNCDALSLGEYLWAKQIVKAVYHSTVLGLQLQNASEMAVSPLNDRCSEVRVRTDPGESWKVMKFKIQIFQAWKVMELGLGPGKSRKVMENNPNGYCISGPCTFSAFTYIIIVHCQTRFDQLFSIIMNCYIFSVI